MGVGRAADKPGSEERAYEALRHRDFRLLWSAELVSSVGTQVQRVAVAWQVFDRKVLQHLRDRPFSRLFGFPQLRQ